MTAFQHVSIALGIGLLILSAMFVLGACRVAGRADEEADQEWEAALNAEKQR